MPHANENMTFSDMDCPLRSDAIWDDSKGLLVPTVLTEVQTDPLLVRSPTEEVLRICHDGSVLWRGRLVESDDDFKKAMLDMADVLKTLCTKGTL